MMNNNILTQTYNTAIGESYARALKGLVREYYKHVSESAINEFILTGDFAALTAEELLTHNGFTLEALERQDKEAATKFVGSIELQSNAKYRNAYRESKKLIPTPLIRPLTFNNETKNLIRQQVQLIKGLKDYQYTKINAALQKAIVEQKSLKEFKQSLRDAKLYNEKRIQNIAYNQLHYATTQVYRNKALELGLDDAQWHHPPKGAYKTEPRPEHVKAEGRMFKLSKGCKIKNEKGIEEYILPAELINCKCYYTIII